VFHYSIRRGGARDVHYHAHGSRRYPICSKRLLSLEEARRVGDAALAKAMEDPERAMSIAVVDAMDLPDKVSDLDVALVGAGAL
jgi:hypothetical protein